MKLHPAPLLLPLLAACASTGGSATTPEGPPARGTVPMTNDDVLVIYSRGSEALLSDPRDEGLRQALELVDDRLIELAERTGKDIPLPALELGRDILLSPLSFRLNFDFAGAMGGSPFTAQLTVAGSPEDVDSISRRVAPFLGMLPMPVEAVPDQQGLSQLRTPVGPVFVGSHGNSFVASLGEPQSADLGLGSMDLPKGVEPDFALKVDFEKLQGPISMGLAAAGKDADPIRSQLKLQGILSDQPVFLRAAKGHDAHHAYFSARYGNYRPNMARQGLLPVHGVTARDLSRVPTDASMAFLGAQEPKGFAEVLRMVGANEGVDLLGMLRQQVGIDLEAEVLAPLGSSYGIYLSDETGGGGLASAVLFLSVDDRATLENTIAKVEDMLLGMIHDETKGLVGIRRWSHGDAPCQTLSFQGLPVPLGLSLGLTDDCMYLTTSPQALIAAIDQGNSGGPGLAANRKVLAGVGSLDGLASLLFQDNEVLIRDGYGFATLLSNALQNGVRSPVIERGPDLVLPTYGDLVAGTQPYVLASHWEGDDLVTIGQADPSISANVTALLGTPFPMLVGALSAAAGASIARLKQERVHSLGEIRAPAPILPESEEEEEYGGEIWEELEVQEEPTDG